MRNQPGATMQQIFGCILMPAVLLLSIVFPAKAYYCPFEKRDSSTIEGRWDITIDIDGKKSPSWLEIRHSGLHTLVGQFVGTGGSARPIS